MTPSEFLAKLAYDLDVVGLSEFAAKCRDYAMIAAFNEAPKPPQVIYLWKVAGQKREGKPLAATIQPDAME